MGEEVWRKFREEDETGWKSLTERSNVQKVYDELKDSDNEHVFVDKDGDVIPFENFRRNFV